MSRRPAYYKEIDERFTGLELKQKELGMSLDNVQDNQAEQLSRINEIHFLLAGTEYEKGKNGGLCGEVNRLKIRVKKNTGWRLGITAVGSFIVAAISFILIRFENIKEFFKN